MKAVQLQTRTDQLRARSVHAMSDATTENIKCLKATCHAVVPFGWSWVKQRLRTKAVDDLFTDARDLGIALDGVAAEHRIARSLVRLEHAGRHHGCVCGCGLWWKKVEKNTALVSARGLKSVPSDTYVHHKYLWKPNIWIHKATMSHTHKHLRTQCVGAAYSYQRSQRQIDVQESTAQAFYGRFVAAVLKGSTGRLRMSYRDRSVPEVASFALRVSRKIWRA